jgi:phospholipid/cholesterol/gamma-HCH transport system permease protein
MAEPSARSEEHPSVSLPTLPVSAGGLSEPFERVGASLREFIGYFGALARLAWAFVRSALRPPFGWQDILKQCEIIGVKSLPIATLIMLFVGLVFALQFGVTLQTMGAVPYVGKVTSLSIVMELGPVFTSLVVGGRVGAGMAAEISSMKVSEQLDAIRSLGADPVKKLLVPRIIATTLMLPILVLAADFVGIFGGMVISYLQFDLSMTHFFQSAVSTIRLTDFASGFFKPFFFGFGIALIGCHEGFTCGHGTQGVGTSTTRTVVNISVMVVLVDFFLTKLFTLLPRV